jgi:hypothetical protein
MMSQDSKTVELDGKPARYTLHQGNKDGSYPDTFKFNEFPGPVFELGGYGDITIHNPATGDSLWVGDAFGQMLNYKGFGADGEPADDTRYGLAEAMRRAISVAEQAGFLD